MRDFTLERYREVCKAVLVNHKPVTVADYILHKPKDAAIMRHDVDNKPENSLAAAQVEADLGISSTYYFRTVPPVFKLEIIRAIHDLGHEIGFHYEVLDKVRGDYPKAIELFERELKEFPYEIKTVCMHGNPLTKWDNRDLWKRYQLEDYGLLGEAYISINYSDILYFSDTGRTWSGKYSVKDVTLTRNTSATIAKNTDDLIAVLKADKGKVCIVTHPQRWDDRYMPWLRELGVQSLKNVGKAGIKHFRGKKAKA